MAKIKLPPKLIPYADCTEDQRARKVFSGWRTIEIDGIVWGVVIAQHHGCNGISYLIKQSPSSPPVATVWSAGRAFSMWRYNGSKGERPGPLCVRLLAEIERCVREGLIVSATMIRERAQAASRKRVAEVLRQGKARRNRMRKVATRLASNAGVANPAGLVPLLVEAMEYARTHF